MHIIFEFGGLVDTYRDQSEVYSLKIKAGKRTYLFDVRSTKGQDYYITITERHRNSQGDGFEKQKIFLYKEDFNKFVHTLNQVVSYVKEELLPDYDFEEYDRLRRSGEDEYD
ncbi:MAG: PUR family DNA/RNA-binding protein [Bacteroidia bacterium]|nr:PUR family DNA/RNA-binding protein [Bacteroidia bacterium]